MQEPLKEENKFVSRDLEGYTPISILFSCDFQMHKFEYNPFVKGLKDFHEEIAIPVAEVN